MFKGAGSLLIAFAVLSAGMAVSSAIQRAQSGAGLMFADVEFFALIAIVLGLLGGLALILAREPGPPADPGRDTERPRKAGR